MSRALVPIFASSVAVSVVPLSCLRDVGLRIEYSFEEDHVGLEGPIAWMTYRNRGILSGESGADTLHWVESALFREENGRWAAVLLHSTRVEKR